MSSRSSAAAVYLQRAPSPLAVRGLGEIGQLEIDRERLGETVRRSHVERVHDSLGFQHRRVPRIVLRGGVGRVVLLAVADRELANGFHRLEQRVALLLADDVAEERSHRAHVAAERERLGVRIAPQQLGEPRGLIFGLPERIRIHA